MSETAKKGKTKGGRRRALPAVLISILVIVPALLIFALYLFVTQLDPQTLLKNAMATVGGSASFDSFDYHFPDSVSADGVKISIGKQNRLNIKSFVLNIDWSSIRSGLIRVDKLQIVRPVIKADLPELKKLFAGNRKDKGDSSIRDMAFSLADLLRLDLKKVEIKDLDVVADDGKRLIKIDQTDITLSGTADINNVKVDLAIKRKTKEAPASLHVIASGDMQDVKGVLSFDLPKVRPYLEMAGTDFAGDGSIGLDKVSFSADRWQSQKSIKLDGSAHVDFGKIDLPDFSFPEGLRSKLNFTKLVLSQNSISAIIDLVFDPLMFMSKQTGIVKTSAGKTKIEISAGLDKNYKPVNVKGSLDLEKGFDMSFEKVKERLENISVKTGFESSAPLDFRLISNVDISGEVVRDDLRLPFHFFVEGESFKNLDSFAFKDFQVELGGTTKINADGKFDLVNRRGDLKLDVELSDLPLLFEIMPENLKSETGIESLDGKVFMTLDYAGSLIPPGLNHLDQLDGSANISIKTESVSISAPKYKLYAKDFSSDLRILTKGFSADITGSAEINELVFEDIFGDKPIDPVTTFDISLDRFGRLDIDNFMLDTQAFDFVESLTGSIEGFSTSNMLAIIADKTRAAELLSLELESYTRLYLGEKRKFSGEFSVEGDTTIDLELSHHPGSKTSVKGIASFDSLDIRQGQKKIVTGLSGTFPFEKSLSATEDVLPATVDRKEKSIRETRFFDDIMQVAPDRHIVRLKQVMAGPVLVSDGEFDISFVQDRLGIDYFRADLMGGSMSGSFLVKKEGDRFVMKSSQVFTGIDIESLLPPGEKGGKKLSKVNGTMVTSVVLGGLAAGEDKKLGIDNIDMSLQLTSIGAKALDRFLIFLDPEQSKPAIVNVRRLLTFARPAGVSVFLKGGALSVSISLAYSPLLGGQKVNMDVIKRAPVAQLVKFGAIQEKLRALKTATSIMRLIGASRYSFDEDGLPVLK